MEPKHIFTGGLSTEWTQAEIEQKHFHGLDGVVVHELKIDPEIVRLKSAMVELGHAVSKSDLGIGSRRHIELFWDLMKGGNQ